MFILDEVKSTTNSNSIPIDYEMATDSMRIRLPQEAIDNLNGQWPWEVYIDAVPVDQLDQNCQIFQEDSAFVIEITKNVLDKLNISIGQTFTWDVTSSKDGMEIWVDSESDEEDIWEDGELDDEEDI